MRRLFFLLLSLLPTLAVNAGADKQPPLAVRVYHNDQLDDEAIVKISGLEQDPSLSPEEVKRRLQDTGLFSKIRVSRARDSMEIVVDEKMSWFVLPYFSSDPNIYGVAAGKVSSFGQYGHILGRYQFGASNHEGAVVVRDEFFLNSLWALGGSLSYEDSYHRVFDDGRESTDATLNKYHGGSVQAIYHINPHTTLGLNNYLERHRFEEPNKTIVTGMQLSHRLAFEHGNLLKNEGLARGRSIEFYFEATSPFSFFRFTKLGVSSQTAVLLRGNFNWIASQRFETGFSLPYYQRFEVGGRSLRGFSTQQFRDDTYLSNQNDFLLAAIKVGKVILRPLVYADWALIRGSASAGVGAGVHLYFSGVVIPALQLFYGRGFNPGGFSVSASVGPQF